MTRLALRPAVWTAGALLVAAAASCSTSSPSTAPQPSPARLAPIDRAIQRVNLARTQMAADMDHVVRAANAADAADAAAGTGDWQRLRRVRSEQPVDPAAVNVIVARLSDDVRAYQDALDALDEATGHTSVKHAQVVAVRQVLLYGRAEADADTAFVRAIQEVWPAYAVLVGKQWLWYDRASTGWYRTHKEAADEYAVLTLPDRTATDHASQVFAGADNARRDAADQYAETLVQLWPVLTGHPSPAASPGP